MLLRLGTIVVASQPEGEICLCVVVMSKLCDCIRQEDCVEDVEENTFKTSKRRRTSRGGVKSVSVGDKE